MVRYSVKLILWLQDPNKDGLFPIYLKILIDGKKKFLAAGYTIQEKMWDAKNQRVKDSHPMAGLINIDITNKKSDLLRRLVEAQVNNSRLTAADLKTQFSIKGNMHNIFEFAETHYSELQDKREPTTLEQKRAHFRQVEQYHGSQNLAFEDITTQWLRQFEVHMRTKGNSNYIFAIWTTIRIMFNAARRKGVITCYPFDQYENPVYEAPIRDCLTLEEIDKLEVLADSNLTGASRQAATYLLLGCYTGLRISDWYRFDQKKHVVDGRILLRAKKNKQWVMMPITPRLRRTLDRIAALPLTVTSRSINRCVKSLKITEKRIMTHTGRHSFAVTMCANRGISVEVCAELMGITVAVCAKTYYKVTNLKVENEVFRAWGDL